MYSNYQPAELYRGPSEWYIWYNYLNAATGKFERFKERFEINRIKDEAEKLLFGLEVVKFINKKLAGGFNPFTAVKSSKLTAGDITDQLSSFIELIIAERATSTPEKYRQTVQRFKRFAEATGLKGVSMAQITDLNVKEFQSWMVATKLSAKTINTTISYMGLFWDEAKPKRLVVENPWREINSVRRPRDTKDIYDPLTAKEIEIIFKHLNENNLRGFARFLAIIYYAWARPIEITRLRIADINLEDDIINFGSSQTKNSKSACVQIVPQLKKILLEMELHKYPADFYVFGTQNFLPKKSKKSSGKIGQKWKEIVQIGLKIPKLMYALKHTGNIHYLLNNKGKTDLKWQQMQNRHSSSAMTDKYNRSLGSYFIDLKDVKFTDI